MNKRNAVFNVSSVVTLKIISLLLGFFSRKIFIQYFIIEYLGLNGVISNLLSFLSLADLGINIILTYFFYKPLAEGDIEKTSALCNFFKKVYRYIALIVLFLGICLSFFLPMLVDEIDDKLILYLAYYVSLFASVSTYFFAYKRTLFIANQQEYKLNLLDGMLEILFCGLRIALIIVFHNYILVLSIQLFQNIVSNLMVHILAKKKFPELNKKAELPPDEKKQIFKEIKRMLPIKIGYIVYGATDNILITIFLGLATVGYFSNYLLILTPITAIATSFLYSLTAGVGHNFAKDNSPEHAKKILSNLLFIAIIIAAVGMACFFSLFNYFIEFWLGGEYLLSKYVAFFLALNFAISIINTPVAQIISVTGNFKFEVYPTIICAVVNLVLSIILVHYIGLTGILIGTVVAHLIILSGRLYGVFKVVIKESLIKNFIKYFFLIAFISAIAIAVFLLSNLIFTKISLGYLILRLVFTITASLLLTMPVLIKSSSFKYYFNLILRRKKQ